jgi:hypothetical protein
MKGGYINEKELKYNEFRRLVNKKQSRKLISWEQVTEIFNWKKNNF